MKKKEARKRAPAEASTKVPLTSYYRGRIKADQSPFDKRPKSESKLHGVLISSLDILLIGIILLGLAYSLFISPRPQVAASSSVYHSVGVYQQAASQAMSGLKNRNKITFDEAGVSQRLKQQFAEVNSVGIELPIISRQVVVRLQIAEPSLVLSAQSLRYIIDSSGRVAGTENNYPKAKNLPLVIDKSNIKPSVGSPFLSTSNVAFMRSLIAQCQRAGVKIAEISLPASAGEVDLRETEANYYVKFNLNGDVDLQSGQFLLARRQFKDTKTSPSEYLDVRVAGKVFYK